MVRRVWLRGATTDRAALVLSFAGPGQMFVTDLVPGTAIDADLCFYPGPPAGAHRPAARAAAALATVAGARPVPEAHAGVRPSARRRSVAGALADGSRRGRTDGVGPRARSRGPVGGPSLATGWRGAATASAAAGTGVGRTVAAGRGGRRPAGHRGRRVDGRRAAPVERLGRRTGWCGCERAADAADPIPAMWPDVLATALVGTARSGDAWPRRCSTRRPRTRCAGGPGWRWSRRATAAGGPGGRLPAGRAGRRGSRRCPARPGPPGPRGHAGARHGRPRLELLAEWLTPPRPPDGGCRPSWCRRCLTRAAGTAELRPLIRAVAGPLAGMARRPAARLGVRVDTHPMTPAADDDEAWELGSIGRRAGYLSRLRRRDPGAGRELLAAAWDAEPPDDRAALLAALATGLADDDEPLLERALDDRRRQVRAVALELFVRLPDSAYCPADGRPGAAPASMCASPAGSAITPPTDLRPVDGPRRDPQRPPAGIGERAWWLEEILARTPLRVWPGREAVPRPPMSEEWKATVLPRSGPRRRRPSATRRGRRPCSTRSPRTSRRAGIRRTGCSSRRCTTRCPRRTWRPGRPPSLGRGLAGRDGGRRRACAQIVPAAVAAGRRRRGVRRAREQFDRRVGGWRVAGLCELAALRLPAGLAPRGRRSSSGCAPCARTTRPSRSSNDSPPPSGSATTCSRS